MNKYKNNKGIEELIGIELPKYVEEYRHLKGDRSTVHLNYGRH